MIIKEHELSRVFSKAEEFASVLIYGPNEGLVNNIVSKVTREYSDESECEKVDINGKDLNNDHNIIFEHISTISMFGSRKVIVIEDLQEKHFTNLEESLQVQAPNTILIIKLKTLNKNSKIRKYYENSKIYFSLACYEDDRKSHIQIIDKFINNENFELDAECKQFLLNRLSVDRQLNIQELEKLSIYCGKDKRKINLSELEILFNDASLISLNKMNEYVMGGNLHRSSNVVNKLLSEGINPISIVRSLMNYVIRIQTTKIEMAKGRNFDEAIKVLKPPVFWKDKNNFHSHCLKWPLNKIESTLNKLFKLEVDCKLNSKLSNTYCEKMILLIANSGRQYFTN